jgi:hypothetical protein
MRLHSACAGFATAYSVGSSNGCLRMYEKLLAPYGHVQRPPWNRVAEGRGEVRAVGLRRSILGASCSPSLGDSATRSLWR